MGPSLTGRTVVIKDETGEIPCGRMSSVQKWVRAPGLPPLSSMVSSMVSSSSCSHSWLIYIFGRTHIWISLVAHYWIYLVALSTGFLWLHFWIYGQFSGNWISVIMKFNRALTLKVRLEN